MNDTAFNRKQEELDRLLNDPDTALRPDQVWSLLEDLARESTGTDA